MRDAEQYRAEILADATRLADAAYQRGRSDGERDRSGALLGLAIMGLAGGLVGFGLAYLPGLARWVCDMALKVWP